MANKKIMEQIEGCNKPDTANQIANQLMGFTPEEQNKIIGDVMSVVIKTRLNEIEENKIRGDNLSSLLSQLKETLSNT